MAMSSILLKYPVFRVFHRRFSLSAQLGNEKIVIPNRIARSPTDILQALASTVGRDHSAPHYKYMDDPILIPASNFNQKTLALSKESGRKAARFIRDKHFNLFKHQPEEPFIEAFYPKVTTTYNEQSNVSEDTLKDLIQQFSVIDAIQVYQICQSKKIDLSENIRQDLLELVCYYNCEEARDEEWMEENWYRQVHPVNNTWKDDGFAELLFESISDKGSKALGALIRGMSQFMQINKAWQLYERANHEEISLDTETYNSILRITPFLREGFPEIWILIKDVLKTMAEKGITPNLGTLNSTLDALCRMNSWGPTEQFSLQVLSEFHNMGIQPSLATYYHLIYIHRYERGGTIPIMTSVMDHIEGQHFEIQDMRDTMFFVNVMSVCCRIKSLEMAHRVNKLLYTGNNYLLIGSQHFESRYYRDFFNLHCWVATADSLMELYNDVVPHTYTPQSVVMEEILKTLRVHDALGYLPQIWSDILICGLLSREMIIFEVLACTANHQPSEENGQLTKQISDIAWDVWTKINKVNNNPHNRLKIEWSAQMMTNLLTTLVQGGKYDEAVQIFTEAKDNPLGFLGSIAMFPLNLLSQAAVDKEDTNMAVNVIIYAAEAGHPAAAELAQKTASKLDLNPQQRTKLTDALGIDLLDL